MLHKYGIPLINCSVFVVIMWTAVCC